MKYTVTPKNIKSIAKLIEKLAKDKKLVSQMFYPHSKKQKTILNNLGIQKHIITQSNVSIFDEVVIEVDFMHDKHFIRIHNNNRDEEGFGYSNFRAFIIYCDDVVEIKNSIIYLRTGHPTESKCKANKIIKFV